MIINWYQMVGYWDGLFVASPMPPKKGQPQNSLTAGPTWWFAARHNGRGIEILLRMRHLRSCNLHVHPLGSIHQGIISSVNQRSSSAPLVPTELGEPNSGTSAVPGICVLVNPVNPPVCWLTHWKAVCTKRFKSWTLNPFDLWTTSPTHTSLDVDDAPATPMTFLRIQITRCWPNTMGPWGWKQLASCTMWPSAWASEFGYIPSGYLT